MTDLLQFETVKTSLDGHVALVTMDNPPVNAQNIQFMEDIDKEVSEMKLGVNSRGRVVAAKFLEQFS